MPKPLRCARDGEINRHALWEQSVFNDVLESGVCGCVARHRGAGCHFANETQVCVAAPPALLQRPLWGWGSAASPRRFLVWPLWAVTPRRGPKPRATAATHSPLHA